ncbi:carboxylesterase family protein, partial [Pseudomonas zeae]|uniref:carboxylesterase family protein n=1 Tax=Pseudomonas zeae TaxID=2745510 RepID=UPI003D07E57B
IATTNGRIRGRREAGLHVFRGVRYGQDTAQRRFQPPLPPEPWRGIVDATDFAPSCPQRAMQVGTSEDCLFLNIWTPGTEAAAKRPVMLYI